jgi:hypothetical protein
VASPLDVACPVCRAEIGGRCRLVEGGRLEHSERRQLADDVAWLRERADAQVKTGFDGRYSLRMAADDLAAGRPAR